MSHFEKKSPGIDAVPPASAVCRSPSNLKHRATGFSVCVVGAKDSLSYQALMNIFDGDKDLRVTEAFDFAELFRLIEDDKCNSGIVPVENTSIGTMPGVFDMMLQYPDIKIIGEHIQVEDHCLCASPGTKLEKVDRIVAHPWGIAQCEAFLSRLDARHGDHVIRELAPNTTVAGKKCLSQPNTATIQSLKMAEAQGFEVLAKGISDVENNKTRFLLLSKENVQPQAYEDTTTTVAFAIKNKTNSLFKAISVFGLRDIDIRRMFTRPTSRSWDLMPAEERMQWEYYMILDIAGNPVKDKNVAAALACLDEFCVAKRVLGTFRLAQDRQEVARQRLDSIVEVLANVW